MQIDEATYQCVVECLAVIKSEAHEVFPGILSLIESKARQALDALKDVIIDGEGTRLAMQKLLDDFDAQHPEIIARIDAMEEKA